MNKTLIAKISVGVLSLTMMGYSIYSLVTAPTFRIHALDIQLSQEASQGFNFEKIRDSLNLRLKPIIGQYTWNIDIQDVLTKIEKDLRIKDAKVRRVLPDQIEVTVTPFTPIANIVANRSDKAYPLARDGEVLPAIDIVDAPDSAILRGDIFLSDAALRKDAVALLSSLPEDGGVSGKHISEIQFDKKRGFVLTVAPSGTTIWVGFSDFAIHALRAQRVLDYLKDQHLTGRIIDARVAKKVVVKLRNEP